MTRQPTDNGTAVGKNAGVGLTFRVASTLLALLCLPIVAARAQGGRPPSPWPQLAGFTPVALGLAIAGVALGFAGGLAGPDRWSWLPLVASVAIAIPLCLWASTGYERRPVAAMGDCSSLTVMTMNAKYGHADATQILALVRSRHVDILSIVEITPELVNRLESIGLGADLPYRAGGAREDAGGTILWSRWSLVPRPGPSGMYFAAPSVRVQPPSWPALTVTAVHPVAPRFGATREWAAELERIRVTAEETAGPAILLGDFNSTRDFAPFRAILSAGVVDAADTMRPTWRWPFTSNMATWPANSTVPPVLRLDHVLLTPETLSPQSVSVVRVAGTDHRGVVVRMRCLK